MPAYAALLRGINLGGHRLKMDTLRSAFSDWGFTDPQTLLASGNVVFQAKQTDPALIKAAVESGIKTSFGFPSTAVIRTTEQLADLVAADPPQSLKVTKQTKLHVTFLEDPLNAQIALPYESSDPEFEVRKIDDLHLFNIVTLGPNTGTLDLMDYLEKQFGHSATTRTWNTVLKIHTRLQGA
ncbi:MAG: DUF1697 domain-containing protein [Chloroflexi bacterium]|nr:DUF1697 domain-containing protein [Chloroflexota bacterium]MQC25962.1 DUF1697 domain-containing protein [Chloroflexota bacterium]